MLAFSFAALVGLLTFLVTYGYYAPDEILSLPGWDGKLPTRQFSGYLNFSSTHLHYWLVESENDPAHAPTIFWFNGGPGCSSLDGFIYEQGPFEVESDHATLTTRPYRWNRVANMVFIESPVGVGFSYSDIKDYKCDDDRTATESRGATEKFFEMYPEYANNKFFISGESYGGVYVPTLAEAIVQGQLDGTYKGAKLTGILVGNGCSGNEVGICGSGTQGTYYQWKYLLGTAFIDQDLKDNINDACDWDAAAQNDPKALSIQCVSLLNQASTEISHVNLYNIYGDCVSDMCASVNGPRGKVPNHDRSYTAIDQTTGESRRLDRIIPHGPDACIDSGAASGYLNKPEVMAAIHVRDPGTCWSVCSQQPGWTYKETRANLPRDTYPLLVANIRVLIFNGDWDACVPYTDGQGWTERMGFPVKSSWHPWTYTSILGNENQVAGYATEYDVSKLGSGTFTFATVKGGRHEVPENAPAQAFEMLTRFINGDSF